MRDTQGMLQVVAVALSFLACGEVRSQMSDNGDSGNGNNATSPPSCIGLANTCGTKGNDSCCTSLDVIGGTYYRSYDVAGDTTSGNPSYQATISTFLLDKYEVTLGRFRTFVNAGMGTQTNPPLRGAGEHARINSSGWDANWNANLTTSKESLVMALKCQGLEVWTDSSGTNENRPMNCITWYEAMAFCIWDGGYLPTEAEWNYAAAGGSEQRAYPWSSPAASLALDSTHASYQDGTTCVGDGVPGCELTDLVPVGTKAVGDGRWGHSDLAGNVFEWTLDWYASYVLGCADCANIAAGNNRVFRGGSFGNEATYLRTGVRDGAYTPASRLHNVGVRCARAL